MTPKVFISYRRDDSGDIVGRIFDYLVHPIGPFEPDAIFRDVDSIPFGVNFKEYLHSAVSQCQVMLLVIGPKWLEITDETGQRRLDSPRDFVRVEIESALQQRIPIIPLLVMNAQMPSEEQLPTGLGELSYLNAIPIRRDPDFKGDIQKLREAVGYWLNSAKKAARVEPSPAPKPITTSAPILISYYPRNKSAQDAASKLNLLLKAHQHPTWIDYERQTEWSKFKNWQAGIQNVILSSSHLVSVYTDEQNRSTDYVFEIQTALKHGIPVIVLSLAPGIVFLPEFLKAAASAILVADVLLQDEPARISAWYSEFEQILAKNSR